MAESAVERHAQLRAEVLTPTVTVVPGEDVTITVEVVNTSEVIETVEVSLLGPVPELFTCDPPSLSLFPEEVGQLTLTVRFPPALPAGVHDVAVVLSGRSGAVAEVSVAVRVEVEPRQGMASAAEPPLLVGRRRGRFEVPVTNDGNVPLVAQVRAADADRVLEVRVEPASVELAPGTTGVARLRVRGRRPWTGSPVEHAILVEVESGDLLQEHEVRFRQGPKLTAGLITALTLALIVLLWALAMFFGVTSAFGAPERQKEIPATFAAGEGVGAEDLDPAIVGGGITGTVTAASTAQPVARLTVEAIDAQGRVAGATATDDDGVYELTSLLPTRYRLRFRGTGFAETWFPEASSFDAATPVGVVPEEDVPGIDARVTGLSGSMGGQVIAGDGGPVPVTVDVTPLDVLDDLAVRTTTTDGTGVWSVSGLPAPATYRITYRATGYDPVDVTQPLEAGQQVVVNTVRLPAASGSLSGTVVDRGGEPVGGVEIEAQRGDEVLTATTPTSGAVGTFVLEGLVTPATYLLTFRAEGFADETQAVRLGPGEVAEAVEVVLDPAAGVVDGLVTDPDGVALGGVSVTVSGSGDALATETFTSGDVGRYRLGGVPVPGIYAVTFSLDGFARETVQVELTAESPTSTADVTLTPSLGVITGIVVDGGAPAGAVTIEISDGDESRLTTTASEPAAARGSFLVDALPAGTYTITASTQDGRSRTLLRSVRPGQTTEVRIDIGNDP